MRIAFVLAAILVLAIPSARADAPASQAGAPASPAQAQLAWALGVLNGKDPPALADLKSHFTDDFLKKVPAEQLLAGLAQIAPAQPFTVTRIEDGATDQKLVADVATSGSSFRLYVVVDPSDAGKMSALVIRGAPDLDPQASSWDEVDAKLKSIAQSTTFLVADISNGSCTTVHALDAGKSIPLGSAFKLYVLSALAHDVEAGKRKWTDSIAIEENKKSLPSGDLQNQPAGTKLALKDVAAKMISISDNTAADHLLWLVGRDAVEAAVKSAGGANLAADTPFLTTREMFVIKLILRPDEQKAYLAASVAGKRKLLAAYDKRELAVTGDEVRSWAVAPRLIDRVEWFASPDDLCKEALALKAYIAKPATAAVADILSINPGVPDPTHEWKFIGFKGGSEPGVMTMNWIVERAGDGKWFFITVGFSDSKKPIDEARAAGAAGFARGFAAK